MTGYMAVTTGKMDEGQLVGEMNVGQLPI